MNDYILDDYFDWLYYQATNNIRRDKLSYRKLMMQLHSIPYRYDVDYDENRASDGTVLRWYYVDDGGDDDILQWEEPCTVLEMLIGLAVKMENIMEEPGVDSSASRWFWLFMENLDLFNMNDKNFDKDYVIKRVDMFLDREYTPNGDGNIFYIPDTTRDLRDVEVWYQMCWYLDSII